MSDAKNSLKWGRDDKERAYHKKEGNIKRGMENVQNKEHGFPKEIIHKKSYKQLDLLIKV